MAEMVPDGLPRGVPTRRERRLFEVLRKLPDDYIVYYKPIVGQCCPDFVLIAPDMGVLVIEVKGWKPHQILGGDHKTIRLKERGIVRNAKHPLRQARGYKWNLVEECKKHPEYRELLQSRGEHEKQFAFPFGNFVIMSNMTADNLKNHSTGDLTKIFRPENIAPRDALLAWEHMSGEEIRQELKRFFDPFWKIAPLTGEQLNILRAVIHCVVPSVEDQISVEGVGSGLLDLTREGERVRDELKNDPDRLSKLGVGVNKDRSVKDWWDENWWKVALPVGMIVSGMGLYGLGQVIGVLILLLFVALCILGIVALVKYLERS